MISRVGSCWCDNDGETHVMKLVRNGCVCFNVDRDCELEAWAVDATKGAHIHVMLLLRLTGLPSSVQPRRRCAALTVLGPLSFPTLERWLVSISCLHLLFILLALLLLSNHTTLYTHQVLRYYQR